MNLFMMMSHPFLIQYGHQQYFLKPIPISIVTDGSDKLCMGVIKRDEVDALIYDDVTSLLNPIWPPMIFAIALTG